MYTTYIAEKSKNVLNLPIRGENSSICVGSIAISQLLFVKSGQIKHSRLVFKLKTLNLIHFLGFLRHDQYYIHLSHNICKFNSKL